MLKAVSATIAITGVQGGVNLITGQRPLRQEFSNFQNSGAAFDLYILSFQQFVQMNQTNEVSYYQVAGMYLPIYDFDSTRPEVSQASMDILTSLGMMFRARARTMGSDIALTLRFFFLRGIDLI